MRTLQRILPLVSAVFSTIVLVLLLLDLIRPNADIFLDEFVKGFLLVTCVLSSICGMLLISRRRRRERGY